jgi:hypothetical protein
MAGRGYSFQTFSAVTEAVQGVVSFPGGQEFSGSCLFFFIRISSFFKKEFEL